MKIIKLTLLSTAALALTACASPYPVGTFLTNVNLPVQMTSNNGAYTKVGEAHCKSILSVYAAGDCSIEAAKREGGITKVHHADWSAHNILGVIGHYKLTVYGD